MKVIAATLLFATAHATVPAWDALTTEYTFEDFKADFAKTYSSKEEEEGRRIIFEIARNNAISHNADKSNTWKQNVNQFSDLTQGEFRNSHGYVSPLASKVYGNVEEADLNIPAGFDVSDLPQSVDWREKNVVTPIKNQGACGSCWAFASTEQIESYVALDTADNTLLELAPQNLVSCSKNPDHCGGTGGCQGSIAELAYQFVEKNGIATEADYKYTSGTTGQTGKCITVEPSAKVSSYVKLKENNYTEVMYALANVGPVAVNVDALPLQGYSTGVFSGCSKDKTDIDHVVQLVGYGHDASVDKDYWILRNSWGTTWVRVKLAGTTMHSRFAAFYRLNMHNNLGHGRLHAFGAPLRRRMVRHRRSTSRRHWLHGWSVLGHNVRLALSCSSRIDIGNT